LTFDFYGVIKLYP